MQGVATYHKLSSKREWEKPGAVIIPEYIWVERNLNLYGNCYVGKKLKSTTKERLIKDGFKFNERVVKGLGIILEVDKKRKTKKIETIG